jgi:acyl phosphate:glycerol-3-phosphate acyltransferase
MATGLAAVVGAYLFGGIPIGLLIARLNGIADIRQHGSGNIGASNVLRVLGVKLGLLVLLLDAFKGYAPVAAAHLLGLPGWWVAGVAMAAIVGHCFSVYLRFTGGKGVATSLGVILGLDWRAGLICLGVWAAIVAVTRYISLASMVASALSAPMLCVFRQPVPAVVAGGLLALLVIERHKANIQRLLAGEERRIGQREAPAEERP